MLEEVSLATPLPAPSPLPTSSRPSGRIAEFDALRGIAILFVMYLHAYFSPWSSTPPEELLFLRLTHLVANSAVPVFLFMSGFLAARDRSAGFSVLIEARLRRLAVPLAFWMIGALAFDAWLAGGLTNEMIRAFALFDISGQFYYVVVLLMLTAALYPVRFLDDRRLGWFTAAAFLVSLSMMVYYRTNPVEGFWWSIAYRNPLVWVFAYTFGLYLGRTRGDVRFPRPVVLAALAGMAVTTAAYVVIGQFGPGYPNSYFGVTVFLFGVCGFVVYPAGIRALDRSREGRVALAPFRALAPYAFGIYLVHKPYFIGELSDRLISDTWLASDYLQLVGSLFLVGGAASIAFVVAVDRLFPRFSALMLGVDRPRRAAPREAAELPRAS
ncbi:MAG: acyltransferase [Dehalococcoidia bacterium]